MIKKGRKLILLQILNFLFIIFVYLNFLRNPIIEEINNINTNINSNEMEIQKRQLEEEKLKTIQKEIDLIRLKENKKLIKDFFNEDINKYLDDEGMKFDSIKTLSTERIEDFGLVFFGKKSQVVLESELNTFLEFLKRISNDALINGFVIERLDLSKFKIILDIQEYSFQELAHSGVVIKENSTKLNSLGNNSQNLLQENFGELKNIIDEIQNEGDTNRISQSNSKKKPNIIKHNEETNLGVKEENENLIENINENKNNKSREKLDELIKKINKYEDEYYVPNSQKNYYVISSEYLSSNYEFLLENPHILENFNLDSDSENIVLNINDSFDLTEFPLVLDDYEGVYYFTVDSKTEGQVKLKMKTRIGSEMELVVDVKPGYKNLFEFKLPDLEEIMPISIEKIYFNDFKSEKNFYLEIKDFVYVEK